MSMFSICMALVVEGTLPESIAGLKEAEGKFSAEAGVRFRRFFQCRVQPHAIWALTEWTAEKNHNDAAQSLMGPRTMIVFFNIFSEQTVQMSFTEHDDVSEKLSA